MRRLSRFLENEAVVVEEWYAPWATSLIQSAASGGKLHLVIDTTKVTSSYRLLCIAIAYRRRTLPLIWSWVGHGKGHCTVQQQLAVLKRLYQWIPEGVGVTLVGDGEFGNVLVLEKLDSWHWAYVLRQAKDTKVLVDGAEQWQRLDQLPITRGQIRLFEKVLLTYASYPTTVMVIWRSTETEPIFVATNKTCCKVAWRLYKKRMWIEEMFGDMKRHGFDLERSRLKHPARLDRLMLVVSLVYLWLVSVGIYSRIHEKCG